uniref:Zinc finger protein 423-like isoform X1 n=1 Tax=Diabrotica virgifera virgifera TaxID=50390 RepID=A0A6P7FI65_DIAVI
MYTCVYCDRAYAHMKKQHIDNNHHNSECDYCEVYFISEQTNAFHQVHLTFECPRCERLFIANARMVQLIDDKDYFECDYCFDDYFISAEERQKLDKELDEIIYCLLCDRRLETPMNREQHFVDMHHFKCNYCDEYFTSTEE